MIELLFRLHECTLRPAKLATNGARKSNPRLDVKLSAKAPSGKSQEIVRFLSKIQGTATLQVQIAAVDPEALPEIRPLESIDPWTGSAYLAPSDVKVSLPKSDDGELGWTMKIQVPCRGQLVQPIMDLQVLRTAMVRSDLVDAIVKLEIVQENLDFDGAKDAGGGDAEPDAGAEDLRRKGTRKRGARGPQGVV